MSGISEKDLYRYFKERRFSTLNFLYDEAIKSKNPINLAILYFLMDEKGEDKTGVFNELVKLKGSKADAYLELAKTSTEIFHNYQNIKSSYVEAAYEEDPKNKNALFEMHRLKRDPEYIFEILRQYKQYTVIKEIDQPSILSNCLYELNLYYSNKMVHSDTLDWELIRHTYLILGDYENKPRCDALAIAYFKLGDIDAGLKAIKGQSYYSHELLKYCVDQGLFSELEALERSGFSYMSSLCTDKKLIFQFVKNSIGKDEKNPTLALIMESAFEAEEYSEVVTHFDTYKDRLWGSDIQVLSYYLLAVFFTTGKIKKCPELERLFKLSPNGNESPLVNIVRCYQFLSETTDTLDSQYSEDGEPFFDIVHYANYHNLEKLMAKPEIISHCLYSDLVNRRKALLTHEQTLKAEYYLKSEACRDLDLSKVEIRSIFDCKTLYLKKEYKLLITALEQWHQNNPPSVLTYKYLAVSYLEIGDKVNALKYYKLAYDLSNLTGEDDQTVAFQYLSTLEEVSPDQIDEINKVKEKYNVDLANMFRIPHVHNKSYYKYCPFNINTIDALANQYFYFPDKAKLNDPIELPEIEYKGIPKDILDNYRVFSLSENHNSMLMWSHYASNHEGICIGFKVGDYLPKGVGMAAVEYNNHLRRNADREDLSNRFIQHLLTKNEDWSYEQETRIFTRKDKVHYGKLNYLDYDREKIDAHITSITLGCAFPEHKVNLIKQLIGAINNNNPKNPKITLRKAVIPGSNPFSLQYELMNY